MNNLKKKSTALANSVPIHFQRDIVKRINWKHRLIGIIGSRGVGKTTLLLQRVKLAHNLGSESIFVSLDDLYFSEHSLFQFAQDFRNRGGSWLYIDDVHKYANWSYEMKRVYNELPDLHVVFAGASVIDLLKQDSEFCRNVVTYNMFGMSFREYLCFRGVSEISPFTLEYLLENHNTIATELAKQFKPLFYLEGYLWDGFYPSLNLNDNEKQRWIEATAMQILESDISHMEGYDPRKLSKLKQLLFIVAQELPHKPNIVKLSERVGIHRNTLVAYFFHLEKAKLLQLLYPSGSIISIMQKPQRVFLGNTALTHVLSEKEPDPEVTNQTFFMSQLAALHSVRKPKQGQFEVDGRWVFDLSATRRITKTIRSNPNGYVATDGLEVGNGKIIPLWMFGLLY